MLLIQIWSSSTVFNIDNNQKCFLNRKSAYYNDFWRSCDTEVWSNDDENTALHQINKLHFKYIQIYSKNLNCNNISQYCCFYCISKLTQRRWKHFGRKPQYQDTLTIPYGLFNHKKNKRKNNQQLYKSSYTIRAKSKESYSLTSHNKTTKQNPHRGDERPER